jgi:hypothetical protein
MVLASLITSSISFKTTGVGIYYLNKIINSIASFENFIIRDIPKHLFTSEFLFAYSCSIIWFKKPSFNKLIIVLLSLLHKLRISIPSGPLRTSKNG